MALCVGRKATSAVAAEPAISLAVNPVRSFDARATHLCEFR